MSDSKAQEQAIEEEEREEVDTGVDIKNEETEATSTPKPSGGSSSSKSTTAAEKKKKKKKGKWKPTHPNSTMMCVEAIQSLKEGKGSSAQAIKKYILATYSTVRPDMVNYMVRTALTNGIQTDVFARPKGDESSGAHGRFKVGKKAVMPTEAEYKPTSHKKASHKASTTKKGTKNKRNDKKGKNNKKSKKKTALSLRKRKKTKPSTKATLKVKASPKPKRAKKKE